jgi:hypothetical protein
VPEYTQSTKFGPKDNLPLGHPRRYFKGSEWQREFDAIAEVIKAKYEITDVATDAQAAAETTNDVLVTPANVQAWADDTSTYAVLAEIQALTDPGADRVIGYDSSTDTWKWFSVGEGLEISTNNIRYAFNSLTELAAADVVTGTDLVWLYDTSAGTFRSITVGELPAIAAGSVNEDTKYKTADQTVTSSDTLADDTHLAAWSLDASAYYRFEGYLIADSGASSTPDLKIALQTSAAFTESEMTWTSHDSSSGQTNDHITDAATAILVPLVGTRTHGIKVQGYVQTGSAATVDFQWAQNTSDGTGTTLREGSWMYFEKIA